MLNRVAVHVEPVGPKADTFFGMRIGPVQLLLVVVWVRSIQ